MAEVSTNNFRDLLNNKHMSDVTFVVEGERFFAHKSILCSSSKYFNTLLGGTFNDLNGFELDIEIRDYSPLVFFRILQYIYTGTAGNLNEINHQMVISILDAATFYGLEKLQRDVEEYIVANMLNIPNVLALWRIGLESDAKYIVSKCVEFFKKNVDEIAALPDFLDQISGIPFDVESVLRDNSQRPTNRASVSWPPFEVTSLDDSDFSLFQSLLQDESPPSVQYNMPNPLLPIYRDNSNSDMPPLIPVTPPLTPPPQTPKPVDYQYYNNNPQRQNYPIKQETNYGHQLQQQQQQLQLLSNQLLTLQQQQMGNLKIEPSQVQVAQQQLQQQIQQFYPMNYPPRMMYQEFVPPPSPFPMPPNRAMQSPTQQHVSHTPPQSSPQPADFSPVNKPPPPSYKTLNAKQNLKRLPMLQGPVWQKALEKMNILIDLIRDTTPADIGTLFLHDPLTNELYSHVTHPEPVDIAMPAHLGIAGSAFTNGQVINSPSAYTDPRFYSGIDRQTGAPTLAILAVPIVSKEASRVIGVVELLNKKRTTSFSAENEKEVAMIARMIARIVEKATNEVKSELEKKGSEKSGGMKRMYQMEETATGKKARSRRRNSIPVFHFKQMKPNDKQAGPVQVQQVDSESLPIDDE